VSIELEKKHQEGEGKEAHIEYSLGDIMGLSILCNKKTSYVIIQGGFNIPKVLTIENLKEIVELMELKTKEIKESNE
jgi:hypothetical protein